MSLEDQEERLVALEAAVAKNTLYRDSEQRLATNVGRLADEAIGLQAILTRVDDQQQQLANLGDNLQRVEGAAVSRVELTDVKKEQSREALEFRKKTLQRIYVTAILVTLFLLTVVGLVYAGVESRNDTLREICQARNEQNGIIVDILETSAMNDPALGRVLEEDIARFRDLLDADCDAL